MGISCGRAGGLHHLRPLHDGQVQAVHVHQEEEEDIEGKKEKYYYKREEG